MNEMNKASCVKNDQLDDDLKIKTLNSVNSTRVKLNSDKRTFKMAGRNLLKLINHCLCFLPQIILNPSSKNATGATVYNFTRRYSQFNQ